MISDVSLSKTTPTAIRVTQPSQSNRPFEHVMVCLDQSPEAVHLLEIASEFAVGMDALVTAVRVMPTGNVTGAVSDPVTWDLSRRAELKDLDELVDGLHAQAKIETAVLAGPSAGTLCREARARDADLIVMGTGARGGSGDWGLGGTARRLLEDFPGSVLLVPNVERHRPSLQQPSPRIVVALDGSAEAEAALNVAIAIAETRNGELVLMHAVPEIAPNVDGPPEPEDEALRLQVRHRNAARAKQHLERVRRIIPADRVTDRVRVLTGEDPRRALAREVHDEAADLLVLSARGLGRDPDLPIGSTAEYLACSATVPVLLIRHPEEQPSRSRVHAPARPKVVPGVA